MVNAADNGGTSRPITTSPGIRADVLISAAATATPASLPAVAADSRLSSPETITVKTGDSMGAIAARNQISLEQLRQLNPQIFRDGPDDTGKKRGADGRLIYAGETVRLRAAAVPVPDPIKTTTVSNKVVVAAKEYLNNAAILTPDAVGGKGREVSQRVVDSAQKMLTLIPGSDPERPIYANKVDRLISDFLAQYPDAPQGPQKSFGDANRSFNAAARAYQDAQKVAAQLPPEDLQAFIGDTVQRALIAFNDAAVAVAALPQDDSRAVMAQQLSMMELALTQMGASADKIQAARDGRLNSLLGGGGGDATTQQAIGDLPPADPGTDPAATPAPPTGTDPGALPPTGTDPGALPPAGTDPAAIGSVQQPLGALPGSETTVAPAVQPMPGQDGQGVAPVAAAEQPAEEPHIPPPPGDFSSGYYTQRPGEMAAYHAKDIELYKSTAVMVNPTGQTNQPPAGANGASGANGNNANNAPNGTEASGRPKKDPNDPKVKQLDDLLKKADHKAVRDLVNNADLMKASLPEQKARMIEILLDGMTTDADQQAVAQLVDLARQQDECEDMNQALDTKFGGPHKGVLRMIEDLKRDMRGKVMEAYFNVPPNNYRYGEAYYQAIAEAMDKTDLEHVSQALGSTAGTKWMDIIPPQAKQSMIDKLKSWFSWVPFLGSGDKSIQAALETSKAAYVAPAPAQPPTQAPAPTTQAPAQTAPQSPAQTATQVVAQAPAQTASQAPAQTPPQQ